MTGYGASQGKVGKGSLFAEVKTVNHRYCDILVKMPNKMNVLEPLIRGLVKNNIFRGKVDIFIKEQIEVPADLALFINEELARKYQNAINTLNKKLKLKTEVNVLNILDIKDLIKVDTKTVDYAKLWSQIGKIVANAVSKCNAMRDKEGENIKKEQIKHLKNVDSIVQKIRKQATSGVNQYKEQLTKKLKRNSSLSSNDYSRIDTEVAIQSDRVDVTEEIARLTSHLKQYHQILNKSNEIGKELDFVLQEMNREANTIGAKSADVEISKLVIQTKAEIEKLREQVQNIE
jgi:uncharacterized protein (TIGR00255 family)